MTWFMNYVYVKYIQGRSLRMSNVDRRSTVPKFDNLTILVDGDSALFPRLESGELMSAENFVEYIFLIFS